MSAQPFGFGEILRVTDADLIRRFPALTGEAIVRGVSRNETNGIWTFAVEASDGDVYSADETALETTGHFAPEEDSTESVHVSVDRHGRGRVS